MTIEQAAEQLSEAVKAIGDVIKRDASRSIYIDENSISVFVLDKEVFKSIDSNETSLTWNNESREYCKMTKRVAGVNFYTLIKTDGTPMPLTIPPIPPDVAEKAMDLMKKEEATTC